MATSEGIPSSIDIEFLELNDNPYISFSQKIYHLSLFPTSLKHIQLIDNTLDEARSKPYCPQNNEIYHLSITHLPPNPRIFLNIRQEKIQWLVCLLAKHTPKR